MKQLHKSNLFCWSRFNAERNIDFHSYFWQTKQVNLVFDPLPLSDHDYQHILDLGGVDLIVITNSDHIRDAENLSIKTGARICAPKAEQQQIGLNVELWLDSQSKIHPQATVFELKGSKTPGELAFLIDGDTLITGDLIRSHQANRLNMLPEQKLKDKTQAIQSIAELAALGGVDAVLVGDGWPIFSQGHFYLSELLSELTHSQ